jgi:hypothetical protein
MPLIVYAANHGCGLGIGGRYLLDKLIIGVVIAYTVAFRTSDTIRRVREAFKKLSFLDVIFFAFAFWYIRLVCIPIVLMHEMNLGNREGSANRFVLPIRHKRSIT